MVCPPRPENHTQKTSPLPAAAKVLLLVGILPSFCWALPQYSLKEEKKCVYCHVDPKGGGPTNARGRYYGQHFTFEGYVMKKKKKKKKAPPAHGTEEKE